MKLKAVEVDTLEEVMIEKGWEAFRTAFDRGVWNILLIQVEPKKIARPMPEESSDS